MERSKFELLIIRFLNKEASQEDLIKLDFLLKNEKNFQVFKQFSKTHYLTVSSMNKFNLEKAIVSVKEKCKTEDRKTRLKGLYKYVAAASVAIFVTIGLLFNKTNTSDSQFAEPIIVNNQIEIGTDKATLTLQNGTDVVLTKGETYQAANVTSNGEEIIYNKAERKDIAFNTLTTPRGGQFQITLSDGTKVWLNSESQLKYPETFTDGITRQVELVYGEAYFDVSSSREHKGSSFKVFNKTHEVEVLGTEFNIKAYKEEANVYTTLVEGKVEIKSGSQNEILKPGEQSNYSITAKTLNIRVVNLHRVTSWKKGEFSFKLKSLKEIMTVLSRWYDIDVVFENKALENERFTGAFYKNRSIKEILSSIKSTNIISNYEIHNKVVVLK